MVNREWGSGGWDEWKERNFSREGECERLPAPTAAFII